MPDPHRPCTWLCNNQSLHTSNTYGFAVCSLQCLDAYKKYRNTWEPSWLMHCSLMRQVLVERVRNGATSFLLPKIREELISRQHQFETMLGKELASHVRKSLRLLDKMDEGTQCNAYQDWYNHGMQILGGFIDNDLVVELYMTLLCDLMGAIYRGRSQTMIFSNLMTVSIELGQCHSLLIKKRGKREEETVNKLVSY